MDKKINNTEIREKELDEKQTDLRQGKIKEAQKINSTEVECKEIKKNKFEILEPNYKNEKKQIEISKSNFIENHNNCIYLPQRVITQDIKGKDKEIYSKTSFQLFFPKKKVINIIEKNKNFQILKDDDKFEENDLTYLTKIEPKGLRNLGGCCYMNSTLQCFYHIKEFTDYFLKNKKFILKKKGLISIGLLDLIEGLSKKDSYSYYIPQKFKDNLIKEDISFMGCEGKDSGDLVSIILSSCHKELAKESELPDLSLDQRKESQLFLDLFYKNSQTPSIINELFVFYVRIESICFECGTKYYDISFDDKMMFSLQQVFRLNKYDLTTSEFKRVVTLEDCLSCFSFDGSFDRKKYLCQYCDKNACIFSKKSFATLPKYLIMLIKRGKNEIFECQVDFEEHIDLKDSYINVVGVPMEKNTKYSLLGGTILYGSKGRGHTVAFCKHFDGKYYIFNDSSYERTSFEKIKRNKIYLLFYKKDE